MDLCGHKALIAQLQTENGFLRQQVAELKLEYKTLQERTLALYKVPESPREVREQMSKLLDDGDLFEEEGELESLDVREDTREAVDQVAG